LDVVSRICGRLRGNEGKKMEFNRLIISSRLTELCSLSLA
jgi:hypothetical protein